MATFSPPATDRCPSDYVGGNDPYVPALAPLRRLLGRYAGNLRAPNVYKLVAGGYTTSQPWEDTPGSVIAVTYLGSHTYEVTSAEAAALTAAGFGAGVS